ncbi:MAG: hypothetical protein HC804_02010 [Anaerolineae bacterium]|nr:hypothetical protein [Anaerolineae bacterium]
MLFQNKYRLTALIALVAALFLLAACNSSGGQEPAAEDTHSEEDDHHEDDDHHDEDEEGDHEHEGEEHDDSEPHARIPNENGAAVHISAPANGDTFKHGDQIIVEIETENFDITEEGYHWHVYVDGESWGMVMGGNADHPLNGVEPGEHEISVFLSIPTHEEYEDGDSVTITVEE